MRWSLLILPPEVVELLISRRRLTDPDFEAERLGAPDSERGVRFSTLPIPNRAPCVVPSEGGRIGGSK